MTTSKFTVTAAGLALAVFTLAGCTADPAPAHHSAPASSADAVTPSTPPTLPNIAGLSDRVDVAAAKAALASGAPFAFGIPDGGVDACHTGLVAPDGELWILNDSGPAPVAGVALARVLKEYGCIARGYLNIPDSPVTPATPPASSPTTVEGPTVPDLAWLSTEVDLGAAQRAMQQGRPFIFGTPDGSGGACHTGLLMPDGAVWVMNKSGAAPVAGIALSEWQSHYGCTGEPTPNHGGK